LADGTDGKTYLAILSDVLPKLFKDVKPDFVFYLSGVDILSTDKLGKLAVSLEDCKQRDRMVFQQAKSLDIPVVVALGGGYSPDIKVIVDAHCNTFRLAMDIFD
jgi:acetoin utilization deacetylase AcuC-like enzyme